jgi:hypothetical protein
MEFFLTQIELNNIQPCLFENNHNHNDIYSRIIKDGRKDGRQSTKSVSEIMTFS